MHRLAFQAAGRCASCACRRPPARPPPFFVSSTSSATSLLLVPLPKLAPHMTSGKVRWLKAEGEAFACYDIIAEISTSTLVEEANREGKFKGEVTLLLEAQEDGFLAHIFQHEPKDLPVGTPVGVLCEEEDELPEAAAAAAAAEVGSALPQNLYSPEAQQKWRVWGGWQAYLKDGGDDGGCSSGCG